MLKLWQSSFAIHVFYSPQFPGTYRIERPRGTVNQIPWMVRCCGFFGDISGCNDDLLCNGFDKMFSLNSDEQSADGARLQLHAGRKRWENRNLGIFLYFHQPGGSFMLILSRRGVGRRARRRKMTVMGRRDPGEECALNHRIGKCGCCP